MNKPVSAKCYSRILNDSEQISPKMRRSRKLSCKKGGVDCEVSRRERDFPNTYVPSRSLPNQLNIQSKEPTKESARKKFHKHFSKCPANFIWPPPPIIFLQPQTEQPFTFTPDSTLPLPHDVNRPKSPIPNK